MCQGRSLQAIEYLRFYRSLETGERLPTTEAQRHFVAVCEGKAAPATEHEKVYAKFMHQRPKPKAVNIMDFRDRYDREH